MVIDSLGPSTAQAQIDNTAPKGDSILHQYGTAEAVPCYKSDLSPNSKRCATLDPHESRSRFPLVKHSLQQQVGWPVDTERDSD